MLTFTSVARAWLFWLVVGRCRVRIFFFFNFLIFFFRISVVEKGGVPLDPPSGSAPGKKDSGDGTTREKKAGKTEAEMDGLCQPRHESYRNDEIRGP